MHTEILQTEGAATPNPFLKRLEMFKDKAMRVVGVPGNSGDVLLKRGLELYLEGEGYRIVSEDIADVIVIHGGGNIDDVWSVGIELLRQVSVEYPSATIVVAPSTCHFSTTNFAEVLNAIQNPVFFFAREKNSYRRLKRMELNSNIHINIADDTAFLLLDTDYLERLRRASANDHVLYAFRVDRESVITPIESNMYTNSFVDRMRYARSLRFVKRFIKQMPKVTGVPTIIDDVSYRDFETFVDRIVRASVIYTDRLHVAIFGAMLGKTVHVYKTKYDKIEGVYEQTLRYYPNVVKMF